MSKRSRKVAFREEVDISGKKQKETNGGGEEKDSDEENRRSKCASFRRAICLLDTLFN